MINGPIEIFFWFMLLASIVTMLGRYIKIPYTIALVVTGLFVGQLGLLEGVHLEPHTLFTVFLPPLLFESGIHIRIGPLRQKWLIIGTLALFGTLLSTMIIGYTVHFLIGLPLVIALLFGAIISPTDPISVLALFKQLGVSKRLSLIVESESLINDGVAVVIFGVIQGIIITGTFSLADSVLTFLFTVLGGVITGALVGFLVSRATQAFDDHLLEITSTTIVAYGAYLAAEAFHVSGVIAVVAASIVLGNYGIKQGMTPSSRLAVYSFWEYAAFAVNSIVFLLIGIEQAQTLSLLDSTYAAIAAIIATLLGRSISVYGLSAILIKLNQKIPLPWQHVFFWSGLRGALSMAMVLGLDPSVAHRDTLVILTFGVVLFSLLVQGLTIERLVKKLGLIVAK